MSSESVTINVGREEFGEVVHMGAYAILLGPYKLTVRVVNTSKVLSFQQVKHFFDHCQAICVDTSQKPTNNGDIPTNQTTEEMEKLKSKQPAIHQKAFLGQIKIAFRDLARNALAKLKMN